VVWRHRVRVKQLCFADHGLPCPAVFLILDARQIAKLIHD
jgi:hypothetical protein